MQKTFLYRGKKERTITNIELDQFDKRINKFARKNNVKASQMKLVVAFDHIFLMETVWFGDSPSPQEKQSPDPQAAKKEEKTEKKYSVEEKEEKKEFVNITLGDEIGALWKWKSDGSLRGTINDAQVNIEKPFFESNSKVGEDTEIGKYYVLTIDNKEIYVVPIAEKVNQKQPDYRIYEK